MCDPTIEMQKCKAGPHAYLLSLSMFRMSSLKVSLFFSSIPLTSYTTCAKPPQCVRERLSLEQIKSRIAPGHMICFGASTLNQSAAPLKPQKHNNKNNKQKQILWSHLSCIVFDSKVVNSNTWLHIERVFL